MRLTTEGDHHPQQWRTRAGAERLALALARGTRWQAGVARGTLRGAGTVSHLIGAGKRRRGRRKKEEGRRRRKERGGLGNTLCTSFTSQTSPLASARAGLHADSPSRWDFIAWVRLQWENELGRVLWSAVACAIFAGMWVSGSRDGRRAPGVTGARGARWAWAPRLLHSHLCHYLYLLPKQNSVVPRRSSIHLFGTTRRRHGTFVVFTFPRHRPVYHPFLLRFTPAPRIRGFTFGLHGARLARIFTCTAIHAARCWARHA